MILYSFKEIPDFKPFGYIPNNIIVYLSAFYLVTTGLITDPVCKYFIQSTPMAIDNLLGRQNHIDNFR